MKKTAGILWIAIMALMLMASGCGKSIEQQIAEQLELGQKYLAEADYEEAVIAFNKVIELAEASDVEINKERLVKAYQGLASSYEAMGNYEAAIIEQQELIKLSDQDLKEQIKLLKYIASEGNISESLKKLEELDVEELDEGDLTFFYDTRSEIIELCFDSDFISPNDLKVNGKPFYEANLDDAIAAYPCDIEEDLDFRIGELDNGLLIYDVGHRKHDNSAQWAAATKFAEEDGNLISASFRCYSMSRGAINQEIDFNWEPEPDAPELRSIEIGDNIVTVVDKLGFSDIGKEYIISNLNTNFNKNPNGSWKTQKWDYSYLNDYINDPKGIGITWFKKDYYIKLTLVFDSDGNLNEVAYEKWSI